MSVSLSVSVSPCTWCLKDLQQKQRGGENRHIFMYCGLISAPKCAAPVSTEVSESSAAKTLLLTTASCSPDVCMILKSNLEHLKCEVTEHVMTSTYSSQQQREKTQENNLSVCVQIQV